MYNSYKPYHVNKIKKLNNLNNNKDNVNNNTNMGFLNITIHDSLTNKPVENAIVEILEVKLSGLYHESGYGDIIATEYSNLYGQVPIIELVSNFEDEVNEEADYEHIHYHMRISADNYRVIFVTNILVFPGITNNYKIELSPIDLNRPKYEFIITPVIK